jgi:hypothetical protein
MVEEALTRAVRPAELLVPLLDPTAYLRDGLRAVACRLADTVSDRLWTDPDVLAGLVDDARRLLAALAISPLERSGGGGTSAVPTTLSTPDYSQPTPSLSRSRPAR